MNKQSKQMAQDDVLLSIFLIVFGGYSLSETVLGGLVLLIFGLLLLGLRIFHLTHTEEE